MDANLIAANVTAVATAGSTTTIAIVAILQTNKRIGDIAACLDRMDRSLRRSSNTWAFSRWTLRG